MAAVRESYRYPGSRPFQDTERDRKLFWGRTREALTLLHLTLAERLVVFFAKSGLGKSSLLNAGLLEPLRERNYLPMVVRVNDPASGPLGTVYKDLEEALHKSGVELGTVPDGRLEKRFGLRLDGPPPPKGEIAEHCARRRIPLWLFFKELELWRGDVLLEPVLIFDQFEELFTLQTPENRGELIEELAHLVRDRLPQEAVDAVGGGNGRVDDAELRPPALKVLLSLREDWLGSLEELAPKIPGILSSRYRLEPLKKEAAREAIVRPAELDDPELGTPGFSYQPEAAEAILDYLSRRRMHGKMVPSDDVEPSQLQIICQYLEELVHKPGRARPGLAAMITLADLGGRPDKVPEVLGGVLEKYYDDQTAKVASWWRRRAVRRLCETGLILDGRRASVDRAILQKRFGVTAEELRKLTDAHLLRAVPRLDAVQYELSHDTLVKPVLASREKRRQRAQRSAGVVAIAVLLAVVLASLPKWREASESRARKRQQAIVTRLEQARGNDPVDFLIHAVDATDRARRLTASGEVPATLAAIYRQAVAESREVGRTPAAGDDADGATSAAEVRELATRLAAPAAAAVVRLGDGGARAVVTDHLHGMLIRHENGDVQEVAGTTSKLTAVAVDPAGERLATAADDGTLRLWDPRDGRPLGRPWHAHDRGDVAAAFGPDGLLASGGADGVVKVWDLEGGAPAAAREFAGHRRGVGAVAWHPGGRQLASGSGDAAVRIRSLDGAGEVVLEGHTRPVLAVAFDACDVACRLASGGADGTLRIWSLEGVPLGELYDEAAPEDLELTAVAWSPDGRRIATGGSDKTLRLWRPEGGPPTARIAGAHDGSVLAVAFQPRGGHLATGGRDGAVRLWRPRGSSFEEVRVVEGFKRYVNAVGWTADGALLAAGSFGGSVKVAYPARAEVRSLDAGCQHFLTAVAFSADGERIASGSTDGTVRLWGRDPASGEFGRLTRPIEPPPGEDWGAVEAVAFSPGAGRIAAGMADGSLRVWDAEGEPVAGPLRGHAGAVRSLRFETADTLVSRGADGTERRWDVAPAASPAVAEGKRWRPPAGWLDAPCRRLREHPLLDGPGEAAARVRELCRSAAGP